MREIDHRSGACVVESAAGAAPRILEIVQNLGLRLAISFDHGKLMVIPYGVTIGDVIRKSEQGDSTSARATMVRAIAERYVESGPNHQASD